MTTRLALLLVLACTPLNAGLWDRDRPDTLPDHLEIITGRFDRFTKEFYAARALLLAKEIGGLPASPATDDELNRVTAAFPLMDDSAVAAIRMGDYAKATMLLDQQGRLIDVVRPTRTASAREASHRAGANEAACLRYRWLRDRDAQHLRAAKLILEQIRADDRHNSDVQWTLVLVEWLIAPPTWQAGGDPVFPNVLGLKDSAFRGALDDSALARNNVAGCVQFLARRVAYEDGWRDLDVMYAYSLALALSGRADEALFAWYRVVELIDTGAVSRVVGAPEETQLKRIMGKHVEGTDNEAAEKLYVEMRRQADGWVESRNQYMTQQLALGRHPDTDPAFWAGWSLEPPSLPGGPQEEVDPAISTTLLVGGLGGLLVVMLLILGFSVFIGRRSAPAPSVDEL